MSELFDRHRPMLQDAVRAIHARGYWTPFPEIPSEKLYGEGAKAAADAIFAAQRNSGFDLPGHPESSRIGDEVSPFGPALGIL